MDIERLMKEYEQSVDFINDVSWHQNECFLERKPIPSDEEARAIVLAEKQKQLETEAMCEEQGHDFTEINVDGENGRSDLDCQRCGFIGHCQW